VKRYGVIAVLVATLAVALGAIWHLRATKQTAQFPAASREFNPSSPASPGSSAPFATPFYAEDGSARTLASFKGRPVLVNFWATWCGPCLEEMPSLDRLAKRMAPEGLAVVALSQDVKGWPKIKPFLARVKLANVPVYFDRNGAIARALVVEALPTTYLIGRDGKALGKFIGAVDWDSPRAEAMIRKYAFN
jgi:thiol-disulfide isomerase/thioredoxin